MPGGLAVVAEGEMNQRPVVDGFGEFGIDFAGYDSGT
jgi:hypothetical protein